MTMLKTVAACLAVVGSMSAGALLSPEVHAQRRFTVSDESTITRTLRFTGGAERVLDVRLISGSIQVSGSDAADVQVEVRRRIRAESSGDLATADRDVVLEFVEEAARVGALVRDENMHLCGEPSEGSTRNEWRRRPYDVAFDVAIRVPRRTRLRLCTINGGEIRVDRTIGDFQVNNVNGRITMDDIEGSGRAETVNGPVTIGFTQPPRATSFVKTVNGDVTITVPDGLSADLQLKTFNGGLFSDFDVEALPQPATAGERRNGRLVLRTNEYARVRVGSGGPEMTFETFNGDVRVLKQRR
jgi:hypothetical protein